MSQIAIDVVLLPEVKITRLAIETNRKLVEKSPSEIVLGRSRVPASHLPGDGLHRIATRRYPQKDALSNG